jgi:hypothetical protein
MESKISGKVVVCPKRCGEFEHFKFRLGRKNSAMAEI